MVGVYQQNQLRPLRVPEENKSVPFFCFFCFALMRDGLAARHPALEDVQPDYREFRAGDVMHSQADIGKARRSLGYEPKLTIGQGLDEALAWYMGKV